MKNLQFPLHFKFQIMSLANDFVASDAQGVTVAYVRQKMFKFIDEINVFNNESESQLEYKIKANKWIDFSAAYNITNNEGRDVGKVARKGWSSMWKANYEIFSETQELQYIIREENGWVKVGDALFGEIPILGIFTGYMFHPSYIVKTTGGEEVMRLKKESSFTGRKFSVTQLKTLNDRENEKLVLGLMMMILLERRRG
jgi:uncharacterized protein YxjI